MDIMDNNYSEQHTIAFHPGSYIQEIIEDLNITPIELAKQLDTSENLVQDLLNANASITEEIAYGLDDLTGISYKTWLNLQNNYDLEIKTHHTNNSHR